MPEKILLKDLLFNREKVLLIAEAIELQFADFKKEEFVEQVTIRFPELELKARIGWIAECLRQHLPSDFLKALHILIASLPKPNNPELTDDDFGDFIYAPYSDFVARYGCCADFLDDSLQALKEITMRFSAEDAIRFFINAFPEKTLKTLMQWSKDKNYHVRRLCSEGTRPKLPWSQKICLSLEDAIPVLDLLFCDKTRYVTRSVANHVNDISKVNPDLALATLIRWKNTGKQSPKEMDYILSHALRDLIKKGNQKVMQELGFAEQKSIRLAQIKLPKTIEMDSVFEFSFTVASPQATDILVDYALYFLNKSGRNNNKKVFKLKTLSLKPDQPVEIIKKHRLTQFMSTRTLYPGIHALQIQINGRAYEKIEFTLVERMASQIKP